VSVVKEKVALEGTKLARNRRAEQAPVAKLAPTEEQPIGTANLTTVRTISIAAGVGEE
jgi:hypothetical protein